MKYSLLMIVIMTAFFTHECGASNNTDIEKTFTDWTQAFNQKNLPGTCRLFSKNVTANYQGTPAKNYDILCSGFKKVFAESQQYQYQFKIHDIYRAENLAAVRITWYLKISDHGKVISETQDEGLDVLQRQNDEWKIVNYIGYPTKP